MHSLLKLKEEIDFKDYTLVVPSVSVGNVPQLTIDLLITSLNFEKKAILWHPAIISSVGGDPYGNDPNEICTACDFYVNKNLKLALIQLRSTISFKMALKFFNDFREMITENNFKEIIILTSGFEYELHNVTSSRFFYLSNENLDELISNSDIKPLEMGLNGKYFVPGSGFALKLYEILSPFIKTVVLIKYVSEGDNRPDAVQTISRLGCFLKVLNRQIELKYPSSWKYVFGGPPPLGMY